MIKWDEIVMISVIINDIKVNVNEGNIVPFSHSLSLSVSLSLSLSITTTTVWRNMRPYLCGSCCSTISYLSLLCVLF